MAIITDYAGQSYTELGTKIVRSGDTLDKNAFLTILAAQLSNQDPTQDSDPTQYVSQLAQFSALEQMQNLNNTMTDYSNRNLIGKGVTVTNVDAEGKPYTGVVAAVTTLNGEGYISMVVNEKGENVYKDFPISSINSVITVTDYNVNNTTSINGTMQYLFASSLIGQNVEITDTKADGTSEKPVYGEVIGTYKEKGYIYVKVKLESGDVKSYTYDKVTQVGNVTKPEAEGEES